MIWKKQGKDGRSAPLPCLVLLALFFLGGVLLGQVLSGRVPDATGDELGRYLTDYLRLDGGTERTAAAALSAAVIYFRYPLLAFLLGFTSLGVVLFFLIVCGLLSLFLPLGMVDRVVCLIGVAIFLGFTAYDTQKIRALYDAYQGDSAMLERASIYSALQLYLDFINLFLYLLRFLGKRQK